jgi:hypothetical protein
MALFMPGRRKAPRKFSYEPRYYNPKKEEDLKRRMRIQSRVRKRRNPASLIVLVVILIFALYVYSSLL